MDATHRDAMAPGPRAGLPRVVHVSWRVDVALRTSEGANAMTPSVILRLALDDGSDRTFECGLEKFHELREATATMVNEMEWASRDAEAVREIGARARARWERTRAGTTSGEEGIATKRNARCGGDDH